MQRVQGDSVSGGPRNGEGKPGVAGQNEPGRYREKCGPWGQILWGLRPIGKILPFTLDKMPSHYRVLSRRVVGTDLCFNKIAVATMSKIY